MIEKKCITHQGDIGYDNEVLGMAADLVGCEIRDFDDGTKQLARMISGKDVEQSPRLNEDELTAFCSAHFLQYQAHYDKYCDYLVEGNLEAMPPIEKHW